MVPPVSPEKSLVAGPGTNVFAPPFVLVKVIVVAVTVATPPKSADPVTLVAIAGVTKHAALKATKLKRE